MQEHNDFTHIRGDELLKQIEGTTVVELGSKFSNHVFTLLVASLGLITALAWDETLRELFHFVFGATETLGQKLLYSAVVTAVAVIITTLFVRGEKRRRKK